MWNDILEYGMTLDYNLDISIRLHVYQEWIIWEIGGMNDNKVECHYKDAGGYEGFYR